MPELNQPLPAAGWRRGIYLNMQGATTSGAFEDFARHAGPDYRRSWLWRCTARWKGRCQRRAGHDGEHYWRGRGERAWWGGDRPC